GAQRAPIRLEWDDGPVAEKVRESKRRARTGFGGSSHWVRRATGFARDYRARAARAGSVTRRGILWDGCVVGDLSHKVFGYWLTRMARVGGKR
ncbi:MAG: hypothetical protein ACKOJF_24490, partial [Planctomycetaceae bacterium]